MADIIELVYFLFFDSNEKEGYVGKTKEKRLRKRMSEHLLEARNGNNREVYKWINEKTTNGEELQFKILHRGVNDGLEKERELELELLAKGFNLKNMVSCGKKGGWFNINQPDKKPNVRKGKNHELSIPVRVYDKKKNFVGDFECIADATRTIFGKEKRYANKKVDTGKTFKGYYFEKL